MAHSEKSVQKEYLLSSEDATLLVVFMTFQSVLGSIANAVVIAFFLTRRHELKTTSSKLTLNLAVADFVALTTYVPWRVYLLNLRTLTKNSRYYTSLFVVCIFCTGNAVLLIALDRFLAVTRPLRYKGLITNNMLWSSIASAWISAFSLGIGHGFIYELDIHSEYELFLSALSFGQLIIISVIYATIYRSAQSQAANISRQVRHLNSADNRHYARKTVWTTFCIICLFYGTYLPYSVYRIVSTFEKSLSDNSKRTTWRWLIAFTFLNSCINPLIYFFGLRRFRSHLKRFFRIRSGNNSNVERFEEY